ncbi:Nn.00g084460.m01.CDS01 [Neocucurbitaria sp. VM-36]
MSGKQTPPTRALSSQSRTPHELGPRNKDLKPGADANPVATEEIRRSGRANKGHHTKNQDALDEPSPAAPKPKTQPPKPDKKAQGQGKNQPKGQPTRAQSTQSGEHEEEEEEEEEDAIIRCVCGDQRDIRGRQMICCDSCLAWQHNKCLGLPEGDYWEGKDYYCEQCKPEQHQELLAAMARGEKPWARKKGSKPKPRPSDVKQEGTSEKATTPQQSATPSQADQAPAQASTPPPASVPAQAQDASNGHTDPKGNKSQPQSPLGEKRRHEPTSEKANASKKRRKSSHHESKSTSQGAPASDIDSLPQNQKALAEKLRETLTPLINTASDARGYRIPDGETAKSLAERMTLQISHAAFSQYGEPTGADSPYFAKLRTIMFNVKKNTVLVDQLLSGSLKAQEFVGMEAEEMASEDKQREYAAMREAAEKQMILTEEAGPRMRKTHKGEELVGEDNFDNHEFKQPNLRERESIDDTAMQSPVGHRPSDSPAAAAREPLSVDTSGPQADSTRRPSTNFDINSVFDKVRSPQQDQQAFIQRRQSSMHMHDKPQASVDDADVDRLLKDEDNDVEMSGYSSDPTVCWQGSISMQSMESFDAVARFVAGGDFGQVVPWDKLLTSSLSVQGRIENAKGDDYIRGIGHTESHEVAILAVSPVTSDGRAVMDHLYNYFHSRGRWGVVPVDNLGNDIMRDLYVIPIEAGGSNLPPFIDMLEYCTIETPRKEHMLLLALIAKLPEVKPQLPATQHFQTYPAREIAAGQVAQPVTTTHAPTNGPSPSPVTNPHGPQFSPVSAAFPPGQYGNPYAQLPPNNGQQQLTIPPNAPPHHHIPRALEILGPYIDAPVIIQILGGNLSQNSAVSELQMTNLRHIVEHIPEARTNLSVLTDHLRQKSEANGRDQNQHPGTS